MPEAEAEAEEAGICTDRHRQGKEAGFLHPEGSGGGLSLPWRESSRGSRATKPLGGWPGSLLGREVHIAGIL